MNVDYSSWSVDELRIELEKRGLKTSGVKDELVGRLELDDAERELDERSSSEPEPTPTPDPVSPPEESESLPTSAPPEPVPAPRSAPGRLAGLPATHQPENQDPEVAYRLLPDGRRVPFA